MDQVASETTAATTPPQTWTNPITTHADLLLSQSVQDKRCPAIDPALLSTTPAATHFSPPGPTVIHIEDMGHPGASPEPMARQHYEIDARQLSSECPRVVGAPTQAGPDSACVLMTPERPCTNITTAVAGNRCCGGPARLTAQEGGKEKEISQLLDKPNIPKNREHKLTLANPANTATDGAGASPPHTETRQPCDEHMKNCLHVNQFSRILPTDEFKWARQADVSGFYRYPPTDLANMEQAIKEVAELTSHEQTVTRQGLETELDSLLDDYTQDTQAFCRFFDQYNTQVKNLRDDRLLTAQTLSQLEANTQALFDTIKRRPGVEIPRAQRDVLKSAVAMKAQLDARMKDIEQKLKDKPKLANEVLEQALYADFCPWTLIEDGRRRAREAEILKEREEWTSRMTTLWRVKEGSTNFQKSAWRWHDVEADDIYPKLMPTYPAGPVGAARPSSALFRSPSEIQQEIQVPPWFSVLDASGRVKLEGETPQARYQSLVSSLQGLQSARQSEETEAPVKQKTFTKEWHEPNPGWPYPNWQKRGGWWTCRSGPDASKAERKCRVCHKEAAPQVEDVQPRTKSGPPSQRPTGKSPKEVAKLDTTPLSPGEKHKKLLAEVEGAMDKCNEKDKIELRARMERQRQANEESDRARQRLDENTEHDNLIRVLIATPPDGCSRNEIFCYGGARRLPK